MNSYPGIWTHVGPNSKVHGKVHDTVRDKVHNKVQDKVHDKGLDKVHDKVLDKDGVSLNKLPQMRWLNILSHLDRTNPHQQHIH